MKFSLKRVLSFLLALVMVLGMAPSMAVTADAASMSVSGNLTDTTIGLSAEKSSYLGTYSWVASGNGITGSVTGNTIGSKYYSRNTTLTIKNNRTSEAKLSFGYVITDANGSVTIGGTTYTGSGNYETTLAAGSTLKIKLTANELKSANTVSISLSNITLVGLVSGVQTTFQAPDRGSYTVSYTAAGASSATTVPISAGAANEVIANDSTVQYSVTATPGSGNKFFGWYNVTTGKYLSFATTATFGFDTANTIKAMIYPSTTPIFKVGEQYFTDLGEANNCAKNGSDKQITLVSSGTISGSYTIDSGITLLIPRDTAYTPVKNKPTPVTAYTTPYAFQTLTMADNAEITVNGSIELEAEHTSCQGAAGARPYGNRPCGPYGAIKMGSGSKITLENGSNLYAWGYVFGNGSVEAKSGSNVYEYMQITDFRGGSMTLDAQVVFPFSQYYVQNIEVPLTLRYGAAESVFMSMTVSSATAGMPVKFIGPSGCMFTPASGTDIVKSYRTGTDRLSVDVYGSMDINSIKLDLPSELKIVLAIMGYGSGEIDSSTYILNLNSNFTINIHSGKTTINQSVALLPGVEITVDQGAEMGISYTEEDVTAMTAGIGYNAYVYDLSDWSNFVFNNQPDNSNPGAKLIPATYSPTTGRKVRTVADLKDVVLDINGRVTADGYVYTTAGGAAIISSEGTGVFVLNNGTGEEAETFQLNCASVDMEMIEVNPAWLKNDAKYAGTENEFTETAGAEAGDAFVYNKAEGKWELVEDATITYDDGYVVTDEVAPATATQTVSKDDILAGNKTTLNPNTFTREGYTFAGWDTDASADEVVYADKAEVLITADTTLYAVWEGKAFQLYIDGEPAGEFALEADFIGRLGKELKYFDFYKDAEKAETVEITDSKMPAHDLYAFSKSTHKLVLDGEDKADGLLAGEAFVAALGKGLDAVRFYSDAACTQVINIAEDKMPAYDLYAKTLYTLSFQDGETEITSGKYVAGEQITAPAYTAPEGTTFTGWWNETDGAAITFPTTMPAKDLIVEPVNKENYDVKFIVDGEEKSSDLATANNNYTITVTLDDPTKANYTFKGWSDGKGNIYKKGDTITNISVDTTLTAEFEGKSYTVKFGETTLTANEGNKWTLTVPADPTLTGHNFAGWATTKNATEADTTYKAGDEVAFTESKTLYPVFTIATYTLTFELGNGTIDDKNTYTITGEYGGDVTLPAITAPEGYKLTGWTVNGASAQKPDTIPATDRTYTANWELIDVTVKFNEGDTKELTGKYFARIEAPTLTKEGYTFLGWDDNTDVNDTEVLYKGGDEITLNNAVKDKTLYAKWQVNTYKVIYMVDGKQVHEDSVAYGADVTAWTGYTAPEGYDFSGWSEIPATMPANNVIITGTTSIKTYTITWNDDEGELIDTTIVKHGETPTHATPTKVETAQYTYTFDGWKDVSGNAPAAATGDTTYTAQFTPVLRSYDITFVVDGAETKVSTKYGETPVYPNGTPVKAEDNYMTYTFAGWNKTLEEVTGEATYTATWTGTDRIYTVTFLVDGETYWQAQGKYGDSITYDGFYEPARYGYNFSGWSKEEPKTFTEDMTITGELIIGEYTIIFMDDDKETELGRITAEFDTDISAQIAEFTSHKTGYKLDQWVSEDGNTVYSTMDKMWGQNLTVYATWQKCYYMFNFYNGSVAAENYLDFYWFSYEEKYDTMDAFVAKTNLSQRIPKGYKIVGLTYEDGTEMEFPYIQGVSGADVIVKLEAIPYTVTFMDGETKVGEITAPYGSDITKQVAAITATKEGYKFNCWMTEDNKCANLSQMPLNGMTVTADFTINEYNINFYATEGDAEAVATFKVPYGTDLNGAEDDPETEEDESKPNVFAELLAQVKDPTKEGHTWKGWDTQNIPATMPAEAVNVYGTWEVKSYKITADGKDYTFQYGAAVSIPDPTKEGHTFNGWNETVPGNMPANDLVLTANWTVNSYTITFDTDGGNVLDPITADYDAQITWPEAPTKAGHTFLGWSDDGETVIENLPEKMPAGGLNLKAVWAKNTVYIEWIIDGVKTTEEYKYGDAITAPEAAKKADARWTYKHTGWKDAEGNAVEAFGTATGPATYTAQFEQDQKIKYTVKFMNGETEVYKTEIAWDGEVTLDDFEAPTMTGNTLSWTVGGDEVSFPYAMDTKEVTFVAQWTPNTYTITADGVEYPFTFGTAVSIEAPTKEGHTFKGWLKDGAAYELPENMPAENIVITSDWSVNTYTLTVSSRDAEGKGVVKTETVPYGANLSDCRLPAPDYTADGLLFEFQNWVAWTWSNNDDATMVEYTGDKMPASDVKMYPTYTMTGWYTDLNGTTYFVKSAQPYFNTWAEIDRAKYWFDGNSHIVKDITLIDGFYHAFDHETGAFLSDLTGIYEAVNGDLYYVENGIAVQNKGLVRIIENGKAHYYYFGCYITDNFCPNDNQCDPYKAQKGCSHWVENNNDLLVKWEYTFDENGVIIHDEAYAGYADPHHEIVNYDGVKYYTIDGVKVHYGLFIGEDDEYYYARSSGELVANRDYWISESHLNGVARNGEPVEEGSYTFDAEGRIVWPVFEKNGVYEENGKLIYYVDSAPFYAGLIQHSGDLHKADGSVEKNFYKNSYLYVRTSGELAVGSYWTTKHNDVKPAKTYLFDAYGRMILTNGFQTVDGKLFYYQDGNPYYAGLIQVDGNWYYVKTSGEVVVGRSYWITKTNGKMPEKSYTFDENGVMIDPYVKDPETAVRADGIYEEDGSLFYYKDNMRYYAGLIQIDGNWYYVRTSGELAHSRNYWITKTNGFMAEKSYTFDANGIMTNPQPIA